MAAGAAIARRRRFARRATAPGTAAAARRRSTGRRRRAHRSSRDAACRAASSASQPLQRGSGLAPRRSVRKPSQTSASCSSSALVGLGPSLAAHARDRLGVEPAEVGGVLRVEPAPGHHRLGAALLERRIVEIGVGPRRQDLERERRRLGQVARDDPDRAGLRCRAAAARAVDVHRLVQAVGDRLADQRMVGDLALADEVLGAGDLVGEDRAIRSSAPMRASCGGTFLPPRKRGSASATPATQRQRVVNIGASSSAWISTVAHACRNAGSARPRRA